MLSFKDVSSARDIYRHHPLFKYCISVWCPIGWLKYLDKVVQKIEAHNANCSKNSQIYFSQVKIKFGRLTIYIQGNGDEDHRGEWFTSAENNNINEFIKGVCDEAAQHCTFCGEKLVKIVLDSKVKKVCWDHMPQERAKNEES